MEETVFKEGFKDEEICGGEDVLELKLQTLVPNPVERLLDIEKDRGTNLLELQGGGHRVRHSVTLLDCGVKGAKSKLVIGKGI